MGTIVNKIETINITKIMLYIFTVLIITPVASAQQSHFSIESKILKESREVIVQLPDNYDPKNEKGYPVLYVLDANHQAIELAARKASKLYQTKVILIGIKVSSEVTDFLPHNIGVKRDDMLIYGNGDQALIFIKDELFPYVDKNFRTNGHNVLIGHSWAGQFSAYSLSQTPGLFDGYFISSPSIGRNRALTFDALHSASKDIKKSPLFVYVSVGSTESRRLIEDYTQLKTVLKNVLPEERDLHFEINEGATHKNNDVVSFPKALKYHLSSMK